MSLRLSQAIGTRSDLATKKKATQQEVEAVITSQAINGKRISFTSAEVDEMGKPKFDFPPIVTEVRVNVSEELKRLYAAMANILNSDGTVDSGNCGTDGARADMFMGPNRIMKDIPATFLLTAHGKLTAFRAWIEEKVPVLDPNRVWSPSANSGKGISETDILKQPKTQMVQVARMKQAASPNGGRWSNLRKQ